MELTCIIQIYKSMFTMKNGLNSINIFYIGSHKNFPIHYSQWEKNFKRILAYLHNEMNAFHRKVQKQVSYSGSLKRFLIYYEVCFKTAGNVFLLVFHEF